MMMCYCGAVGAVVVLWCGRGEGVVAVLRMRWWCGGWVPTVRGVILYTVVALMMCSDADRLS